MRKILATLIGLFLLSPAGLLRPSPTGAQDVDAVLPPLAVVAGVSPGTLALIDLSTFRLIRTVQGLAAVHGAAISPDGSRAYALSLSKADQAISVIDVHTGSVIDVIGLDAPSHHAAMDPSGDRLYLTWGYGGTGSDTPRGIAAFDPENGAVANITTEGTPYYVAVSPDGAFLYGTTLYPGRVVKIALPAFEVVAREALEGNPNHIAVAEDGSTLFITLSTGGVAKVDAGTLQLLGTVDTGPDAHAVALAGDPVRLFVTNRGASTLTVLDPGTLARIDQIETPPIPSHLLRLPEGALLISAVGSKEAVKLDPNSLEVVGRISLPMEPHQTGASRKR
jgi:YVTN family beta-propeller protein